MGKHLHFGVQEFATRQDAAVRGLTARGLDGLLIFRQESMYYLTGYDTFGYVHFQALFLGADGRLCLLTRAPDRLQAGFTSVIEDIRVWVDGEGANPYTTLRGILEEHGINGGRIGIELEAYGLTAAKGLAVLNALEGFCAHTDASDLVSRQRLVKSPAELKYVRRAAELADASLREAARLTGPGAFEGDILAAMQSAVFQGGGDDPANETIIGSGPGSLMCRYFTGRRHLDPVDQLTLEFAGVYRHYHACLMRTLLVGEASAVQRGMHSAAVDAMQAAREALRPGRPIGAVFDAHAQTLDAAGHREHRMNACGYSLGTTFAPNWMDWPMFYSGNPVIAEPGMVFFIHIILFDAERELAMTLGQTVEVTGEGNETLSGESLDLIVK
jgi:Xaa-Pro dipeptidase